MLAGKRGHLHSKLLMFGFCLAIVSILVSPIVLAQGVEPILIRYSRFDKSAAQALHDALMVVKGRESRLVEVEAVSSFDAVKAARSDFIYNKRQAVAVVRWTRSASIPKEYLWDSPSTVTLGPGSPVMVHVVSWMRAKLAISGDAANKKSLENKKFGIGVSGTATEEDALNLLKAIDSYPCPPNSTCYNAQSFQDEIKQFLGGAIDAFFLSADCPDPSVQTAQDRLQNEFFLVPIPTTVAQWMKDHSDKPYVATPIDPKRCTYSTRQGVVGTVGVSRSFVAAKGIDEAVAADIASSLIQKPPFSKSYYASVLRKIDGMFPIDKTAKKFYEEWLK